MGGVVSVSGTWLDSIQPATLHTQGSKEGINQWEWTTEKDRPNQSVGQCTCLNTHTHTHTAAAAAAATCLFRLHSLCGQINCARQKPHTKRTHDRSLSFSPLSTDLYLVCASKTFVLLLLLLTVFGFCRRDRFGVTRQFKITPTYHYSSWLNILYTT